MTKFKFDIDPLQQVRPRIGYKNVYNSKKRSIEKKPKPFDVKPVKEYKEILGMLAVQQVRLKKYSKPSGALSVRMSFTIPMLKSFTKKQSLMAKILELLPHKKPDLSNYIKSTEDALNGILWNDDGQICQLICDKRFGDAPSVQVEVSVINQNEY